MCQSWKITAARRSIMTNFEQLFCVQVGDELFNWSLQQLVDLSYMWSSPGDTLPTLPVALPLPNVLT